MACPNPCDQKDEPEKGRRKVAQAFQPVNRLEHSPESLCRIHNPHEIAMVGCAWEG